MKNYIFVTGAPGSMWSRVGQEFRWNYHADMTDETPEKIYSHHKYNGHKGNYYGPGMQYGKWLDKELGTKVMWTNEIIKSFDGPEDQIKVLMSHNFAYYLEDIMETFPESKIVAVVRDCDDCMEWWKEAGGWDITYPSYEWYENDIKMKHQIYYQNKAILKWIDKYNVKENEQIYTPAKVHVYK